MEENVPHVIFSSSVLHLASHVSRLASRGFMLHFKSIVVYDALGKEVARLVNDNLEPGNYESVFDAGDLTRGMYFYKLTSGSFSQVKKMLLIK